MSSPIKHENGLQQLAVVSCEEHHLTFDYPGLWYLYPGAINNITLILNATKGTRFSSCHLFLNIFVYVKPFLYFLTSEKFIPFSKTTIKYFAGMQQRLPISLKRGWIFAYSNFK